MTDAKGKPRPLDRAGLAKLTVAALSRKIDTSPAMREWIKDRSPLAVPANLVNMHAWALVDLQRAGRLVKIAPQRYRLVDTRARDLAVETVAAPSSPLPLWARRLIGRANRVNRDLSQSDAPPIFGPEDLWELWERAGGCCEVTGLPFSMQEVGTGKAKRVYAPSLDRIDGEGHYTLANCRLVMVGINFAINRWGLDTYLRLAEAAVAKAQAET